MLSRIEKSVLQSGYHYEEAIAPGFKQVLDSLVTVFGQPKPQDATKSDVVVVKYSESSNRYHNSTIFDNYHSDGLHIQEMPRYVLLYCEKDCEIGGTTYLVKNSDIISSCSESLKNQLREKDFLFQNPITEEVFKDSIIDLNGRIRFLKEYLQKLNPQSDIFEEFDDIILKQKKISIKMAKNSFVFFDNYRFLHGREQFLDLERTLYRVWF